MPDAPSRKPDWTQVQLRAALEEAGLPGDLVLREPMLIRALTEGRWRIEGREDSHKWDAPGTRYEIRLLPKSADPRVRPYEERRVGQSYMDTRLAEIGEGIVRPVAKLREGTGATDRIKWAPEKGFLFRGVSFEEWQAIKASGEILSDGSYNLGTAQEGLTFYSFDPAQAASYAGGFAPWHRMATFDMPSYVLKVRRPEEDRLDTTTASLPEVGVRGAIPVSDIVDVMEVRPYEMGSGYIAITRDLIDGSYVSGSRSIPTAQYAFRPHDFRQELRVEAAPSEHRRSL